MTEQGSRVIKFEATVILYEPHNLVGEDLSESYVINIINQQLSSSIPKDQSGPALRKWLTTRKWGPLNSYKLEPRWDPVVNMY